MSMTNYGMTFPAVGGVQYMVPWLHPSSVALGTSQALNSTQVVVPAASVTPGGLTTTGGETVGGSFLPGTSINHVSIVVTAAQVAQGAVTFIIPHGLTYAPTWGYAVVRLAEGTTPANFPAFVPADTNATNVGLTLGVAATWDIFYA